jgi:hypothetical protein
VKATIENFIGIYEEAFPKEYCDLVINYFEQLSAAGLTESRQSVEGVSKLSKDDEQLFFHEIGKLEYSGSTIAEFNNIFWGQIYPHYANTFDALKNFSPHSVYTFKVQKTKTGQGYHIWHSEGESVNNSTRILAWTLYLNDVEEGGETEFIYYPKRVKPKTGTFVLWPAGFTHTHRGNPPLSNTKYIVTGWVEF